MSHNTKVFVLGAVLVLSLIVNAGLIFLIDNQKIELVSLSERINILEEQRVFLMMLLPKIGSSITKGDLKLLIEEQYPDEEVNQLNDHVQWRLFHFWFDNNGKLVSVKWSS